jgi:hypothetical protein
MVEATSSRARMRDLACLGHSRPETDALMASTICVEFGPMSDWNGNRGGHVLFLWSANGWTLQERDGDPPTVGSTIQDGDRTLRVSKIGPSPLPGDRRPCAFTQLD